MTAFARLRAGLRRLVGSPERDRLAAYLVEAWADLDRELHRCCCRPKPRSPASTCTPAGARRSPASAQS